MKTESLDLAGSRGSRRRRRRNGSPSVTKQFAGYSFSNKAQPDLRVVSSKVPELEELCNKIVNPLMIGACNEGLVATLKQRNAYLTEDHVSEDDKVFDSTLERFVLSYARRPGEMSELKHYLDKVAKTSDGTSFARSKFYLADYDDRLEKYLSSPDKPLYHLKNFRDGVEKVRRRYSQAQLTMFNPSCNQEVMDMLRDSDTSVGFTAYASDYRKKQDISENAYSLLCQAEEFARTNGTFGIPYVLWNRTGGNDGINDDGSIELELVKISSRPVWIDDVLRVLSGTRFTNQINEWFKVYSRVGHGKSDLWLSSWFHTYYAMDGASLESDYSKFDSTQPSALLYAAFDIVESMFRSYDKALLHAQRNDYIHKTFWHPSKGRFMTTHIGNPSGSAWTSIINDIVHEIILETVHIAWQKHTGKRISDKDFLYLVVGDDEVEKIRFYDYKQLQAYKDWKASYITSVFNITCKPEACKVRYQHEDATFLSRKWDHISGPYRNWKQAWSKMLLPERFRDYRSGKVRPEIVLFSYWLCYGKGVEYFVDIPRFLKDHQLNKRFLMTLSKEEKKELPYIVQEYIRGSHSTTGLISD